MALDGEGRTIRSILPRRTQFVRQAAGRRTEPQVVAANVDVVFLLTGLDDDFSLRRIERYLTLAHASGAIPVVLLTKAGLRSEDDRAACVAAAREVAGSVPVHAIDVLDGIEAGVPYAYVKEETTVAVLGLSGVGKSTLVNHLLGEGRARTGIVSAHDGTGLHTTTWRELFFLPKGGAVIDTPGMRELQLWADDEALDAAFEDVRTLAGRCKFNDCRHAGEPGCAVREACESGAISPERLESYQDLQREIHRHAARRDARDRRANERTHARLVRKVMKQKYGR